MKNQGKYFNLKRFVPWNFFRRRRAPVCRGSFVFLMVIVLYSSVSPHRTFFLLTRNIKWKPSASGVKAFRIFILPVKRKNSKPYLFTIFMHIPHPTFIVLSIRFLRIPKRTLNYPSLVVRTFSRRASYETWLSNSYPNHKQLRPSLSEYQIGSKSWMQTFHHPQFSSV